MVWWSAYPISTKSRRLWSLNTNWRPMCYLFMVSNQVVAAAFLAYVGDAKRFSSPARVANYIGLVPRIDCSGETHRYGHIT